MKPDSLNQTAGATKERLAIWLLCLAGAVHVFIFAAAFPVFNQLDEGCHFDLVVRYSHGQLPRGLQPMCREASLYLLTYRSPEFAASPRNFPDGRIPTPSWKLPGANQNQLFQKAATDWETAKKMPFWTNYETSQPPLYYTLAGIWWRVGECLGITGLHLVYWLRFLNVLFVAALVWIGHCAAREVFPGQPLFTLGVPALIAFAPVQAFYSIQNDVLSPVCFGITFILLLRLWRAEIPGVVLGATTGLAMAATFLTKLSNAPLLAVAGIFILIKVVRLEKSDGRDAALRRPVGAAHRPYLPALVVLCLCAALPVMAWLAWLKIAFGDFTGSAAKLHFITWTLKPFSQWWHHPIFTPEGFWTFCSQLVWTSWQGSIHWYGDLLVIPAVNATYSVLTLSLLAFALLNLLLRRTMVAEFQRNVLWFSFGLLVAGAAFLAFLSIIYDFGICMDPSREHPYFAEGRLILGAMVPGLLLYLCGLDYFLQLEKKPWSRAIVLPYLILFMLAMEFATDRAVFASQYNWYHLF